MFHKIDYENWDRKDIYELFRGYSYSMTVEADMTALKKYLKKTHRKFYPVICWVITKTINSDMDYRFVMKDGEVGYFDVVNSMYTLRRNAKPHLFTHMITEYSDNIDIYYERFLRDKDLAENEDRLYYYEDSTLDAADISVTPNTSFKSVSLCIPQSFYERNAQNLKYTPFVTVGKFFEQDGKVILPVTANFQHAVNDGYHAEKFFRLLQENLDQCF